jgi:NADH-quinone oxidoreductase subunit N
VFLGLAMAASCFSLIGIPLTVGFMGKLMIIKPALAAAASAVKPGAPSVRTAMTVLIVLTMVNAAVSAAYYLRIVATMFLRTAESAHAGAPPAHPSSVFARPSFPVFVAVLLSVTGVAVLGSVPSATELLGASVKRAAAIENDLPRMSGPRVAAPLVSR